jgi:outer membrane protein TolC
MRQRAGFLVICLLSHLAMGGLSSPGLRAQDERVLASPGNEPGAEPQVLSLQECVQAALENNFDIAISRYEPLKSETVVTLEESGFDPNLNGNVLSQEIEQAGISNLVGVFVSADRIKRYGVTFRDPLVLGGDYEIAVDALGNERFGTTGYSTAWRLTFRQPLLRNLGPEVNRTLIVVARNTLGISESQFRQTVLDTVGEVEKAYWDLNFALMEHQTVTGSLQQAKDFLEQNKIKVRVGTLAPIEITQAEAQVAEREQTLIVAEFAIEASEDNLRRVMGTPIQSPAWSRPIRPSENPPLVEVSPVWEETVAAAAANRPDLEQARLDLASRELELKARENQRRWALDFEGWYGTAGFSLTDPLQLLYGSYNRSFDSMLDSQQTSWSLALNLNVPIGNRQAIANYTGAKYSLSQAEFQLQRVQQNALLEVRDAVRRVFTDLKRVRAAEVSTRLQREKLAAEEKKFENGMSTSFEVLTFQTDLAQAETRQNLAIVDYNKSLVELERVKGTLLQARGIVVPREGPEEDEGSAQSAALRALWRKNPVARAATTLHLPDTGDGAISLPSDFTFDPDRLAVQRVPGAP